MVCIAVGPVADKYGLCRFSSYDLADATATVEHRYENHPSDRYSRIQPYGLPVLYRHRPDTHIGTVVHLHRRQGRLTAVAELDVDAEMFEGVELRWSSGTATERNGEYKMGELSLTPSPASVGLWPVRFWSGTIGDALCRNDSPREILRAATATVAEHRRNRYSGSRSLVIDDGPPPRVGDAPGWLRASGEGGESSWLRNNGDGGLFYSGVAGRVLRVWR
jgi:hypothetical protein